MYITDVSNQDRSTSDNNIVLRHDTFPCLDTYIDQQNTATISRVVFLLGDLSKTIHIYKNIKNFIICGLRICENL